MRIVSLLPSATEIVYALGLDDNLVGVTFECNEPPAARLDKAIVVGGRDTTEMTPGAIDAYVRAKMASGEDLYTLHADALADLDPDLIITQDLCRVCAVPSGQVGQALAHLGCSAEVVSLDPCSLNEVLETILTVGMATGTSEKAASLVAALRERLSDVAERVARRTRRRVAVLEWVDPPFSAGHWVPDLVSAAGAVPVLGVAGGRSIETTWVDVRAANADLVIVAPCGFRLDAAIEQAQAVAQRLPGTPVWAIDADAFVVRPGPRLVDGVEAIASIVHPDAMPTAPPNRIARVA